MNIGPGVWKLDPISQRWELSEVWKSYLLYRQMYCTAKCPLDIKLDIKVGVIFPRDEAKKGRGPNLSPRANTHGYSLCRKRTTKLCRKMLTAQNLSCATSQRPRAPFWMDFSCFQNKHRKDRWTSRRITTFSKGQECLRPLYSLELFIEY